jgi:RimJ/RimL family protein N-acetyltransferase
MPSFTLRPFNPSDAKSLAYHANNRKVWEGVRDVFPFPYTEKDADFFIAYALSTQTEKVFAIDVDGKAVGAIGLHFKDDVYKLNGEIGYWLGVQHHGKGIATAAVAEIVQVAFNNYKLLRVYAEVFANNPASARVLEKNGFTHEATFRKSIIKDGKIDDSYVFSRVNPHF